MILPIIMTTLMARYQDPLSLDEAVSTALKNAFTIRIAESRAERARRTVRAAQGAFGPNINVQANYSRFDGSVNGSSGSSGGGTGGGSGGSGSSSFGGDSKSAVVTLSQPIDISGRARAALDVAKYTRDAIEEGLAIEANDLKRRVRTAYFTVVLREALVKVQQDALTAAQQRLDKAVIREQNGAIPRFDVLRFQNEVRKSEEALTQALGNLENAKHDLNSAMAVPIEAPVQVAPIDALPGIPGLPTDLVIEGIQNRPEIKQSEFTIMALTKTEDVQAGAMKPSLAIQASHTRYVDPSPSQTNQNTIGNVVLSIPVFDSGINRALVEQARFDTDVARINLEQLLLGVALEVRNAHTLALTAQKAYEVSLDGQRLAAEALRLAEIRYNEGAGILIDVTQAQADLTAAAGNVQNAKFQLLTAYSNLLRAIGKDDLTITANP